MKNTRKILAAVGATVLLSGLFASPAQADPLPGGGAANISVSGNTVTVKVTGTTGTSIVEAITDPQGSPEVQVDSKTGVNPTLVVKVPQGITSDVNVEVVRNGVITKMEVRVSPGVNVYTTPGEHFVGGREWRTTCGKYSSTITRCETLLKSGGTYVFNNLTYLPSPRSAWVNNPIGGYGQSGYVGTWSSGGRQWRVECDTAATGNGACRSSIMTGGKWVLNNMVLFS